MATPADRGWGTPGRKHGDAQAREYGRLHIITITTDDDSRFSVRKEVAPILLGFLNEIIGRGYRIKGEVLDDWGWYVRTIAGSSTLSNHSWGLAIDVNAMTNPQGRKLTTDMPAFVPEAAKRWGLRWGGTYSSRPDAMHFEWVGSRDEALRFVADLKDLHTATSEDEMPQPTDVIAMLKTSTARGAWLLTYAGGVITEGDAPFWGSYPGLPPHARQGSRGFYIITVRDDAKPGYMLVGTDRSKYRFGPKEAA